MVTPLLRAYLQSSRVGWFVWSVFSECVCGFSLDYRERKEIEIFFVAISVGGRIGESLHEVEVRWIRE